jgi:hypothetical protein
MLSPLEIAARQASSTEERHTLSILASAVLEAVQLADQRGERLFIPALVEALAERFVLGAAGCDLVEDEATFLMGDC